MHRGYTKRWRKRWDNGYHLDPYLWLFMSYFIDHANYRDTTVYLPKGGAVPLKRGQHLFGSRKLSAFMGVARSLTRRKLKILENIGFLTLKSTHSYTIATVINYDIYQSTELPTGPQIGHQPARKRPASGPQPTTPNKDKKVKKVKNKEVENRALPGFFNLPTYEKAKALVDKNIFPKALVFLNTQLKKNKNQNAINHTLSQCYLKAQKNGFKKQDAWAYCQKIINVESANYNEQDYVKEAERQKKELQKFIDSEGL